MHGRSHDAPVDAPVDSTYDDNTAHPTGLLTRFVPHGFRNSFLYRLILRLTRVLQFLSSVISLGLFSRRLSKVRNLINTIKRRRGVNSAFGAVEGILAAAVLYTLITMVLSLLKKNSSPGGRMLRWLWVVLDMAFVGAFIAVAVLTRPDGGRAGPNQCYRAPSLGQLTGMGNSNGGRDDSGCDLPWGTFILAIISTVLHALTAAFHEFRDHRRRNRLAAEEEKIAAAHGPTTTHGGVVGTGAPTTADPAARY